jgi:hypothetical protein
LKQSSEPAAAGCGNGAAPAESRTAVVGTNREFRYLSYWILSVQPPAMQLFSSAITRSHSIFARYVPCKLRAMMITTFKGRQLPSFRSTVTVSPKVSKPRGWKSAQANRAGASWGPSWCRDGRGPLALVVEKFEIRPWKAEEQKKTPSAPACAREVLVRLCGWRASKSDLASLIDAAAMMFRSREWSLMGRGPMSPWTGPC